MNEPACQPLFPLIRHVAEPMTAILLKTPVTPNQVTWASIMLGLAGSVLLLTNTKGGDIACGLLFIASYVLDNCDGDVARAKNMRSAFGAELDSTGDFVVHLMFFALLGVAIWQRTGEDLWLWFGAIATLGNVVNYLIYWLDKPRHAANAEPDAGGFKVASPKDGFGKWLAFVLRELMRADFCFIMLGLAFFDQLWVLLPLGAAGAQAYWLAYFVIRKERYHV